ncbi:MAG: hypothetical protein JXQ73_06570 [Phycisphaerae bacterium]|nr:hypothetical protein [Phycisphaerae bacterium]
MKVLEFTQLPLLKREGDRLIQAAEIVIRDRPGDAGLVVDVIREADKRSTELREPIAPKKDGQERFLIFAPEVAEPVELEFVVKAEGRVIDRRKLTWRPQRHWEVYLVPMSHHDLGYTATIEEVLDTWDDYYDRILGFCEQTDAFPGDAKFRYHIEQAWSIVHFVRNRPPDVLAKLGKYVAEGRIELPAFVGNQITGMHGHEEMVRLLYPSFALQRRFGGRILSGDITDVPGMSWAVPTVLAGAGVKYLFAGLPTYFEWRAERPPGGSFGSDGQPWAGRWPTFWDEKAVLRNDRPDAFWWQGPDGARILVYYSGSYGGWQPSDYDHILGDLPHKLKGMETDGSPLSVVRYTGWGCGDNKPPSVAPSHLARQWNETWAYPRLIVSTNTMFFESLEKQCADARTFRGELPHTDYAVGALCSARETTINRLAHDQIPAGERLSAIVSMLGEPRYPADQIREAYYNMMLYDEHTWGMSRPVGAFQEWNWADKSRFAYAAAGHAARILPSAVDAIADRIALDSEGRHLVVFNTLSFERTDVVAVTRFPLDEPFDLIDEQTGKAVAYQVCEIDDWRLPVPWAADLYARGGFDRPERLELRFVAEHVPSMGYKTYRLQAKERPASFTCGVDVGAGTLENRFFRISVDPKTGAIASLHDKRLDRELVDKDCAHQVNQFVTRQVRTGETATAREVVVRPGRRGPVLASLLVTSAGPGCPQITQEIILYDALDRIDLANRVLKDATPLLEVYFAFPFKVDKPAFRFEGTDSVIRPHEDQLPGSNTNYYSVQHWAHVGDGSFGVTLAPVDAHIVEFGGLWPCYVSQAHHGVTPVGFRGPFVRRDQVTRGHMYSFVIDTNFRTNFKMTQVADLLFRYSVTAHKGDWLAGGPRDFGWAASNPLAGVWLDGKRAGSLPNRTSFCRVEPDSVLVLALKRAEDGEGLILRLIETEGKPVTAKVALPHLSIRKASRTNLVERDESELSATDHEVAVPVPAFGIATVRLRG